MVEGSGLWSPAILNSDPQLNHGAHHFSWLLFPQLSNREENINITVLVAGGIENNTRWVLSRVWNMAADTVALIVPEVRGPA